MWIFCRKLLQCFLNSCSISLNDVINSIELPFSNLMKRHILQHHECFLSQARIYVIFPQIFCLAGASSFNTVEKFKATQKKSFIFLVLSADWLINSYPLYKVLSYTLSLFTIQICFPIYFLLFLALFHLLTANKSMGFRNRSHVVLLICRVNCRPHMLGTS